MKFKTTKREVMKNSNKVYSIGYCDAYYLLLPYTATAYTYGDYGWNSDIYTIGNNTISTGYRPFGKRISHEILKGYEDKAKVIYLATPVFCDGTLYNETMDKIKELLQELLSKL